MSQYQALHHFDTSYTITMLIRQFRQADYEAALSETIRIGDQLPPTHLARWLASVLDTLDLTPFYSRYALIGAPPYAPEIILGLLLYGYMTGITSPRAIEQAVQESLPFRFLAANTRPDASTLTRFRSTMLPLVAGIFAQVLARARQEGFVRAHPIVSIDGSKIQANASKHHAVSYQYACRLRDELLAQTADLLALADTDVPEGMEVTTEILLRLEALEHLDMALAVIEARADHRYQTALAEYQSKIAARAEAAERSGRKPGGRPPAPPSPLPAPGAQYNFTDPESRVMKNSTDKGFNQCYNAQIAVEQTGRFIVGYALSNHPNDKAEATAALDAIPPCVGVPAAAALDTGYFSLHNIEQLEERGTIPLIACRKQVHGLNWERFHQPRENAPSPDEASPLERMIFALDTTFGHDIYSRRKSTVEPVFGILKSIQRFRQFSLRGEACAGDELGIVCLAYNLKRLFTCQASALKKAKLFCGHYGTKILCFACSYFRGRSRGGMMPRQGYGGPANSRAATWELASPTDGWRFASGC